MRLLYVRLIFVVATLLKFTNVHSQWTLSSPFGGAIVGPSVSIGTNLLVGTTTGGIFLSGDNGAIWTTSNTGLTNNNVTSFAIIGVNLFAGTMGNGVFISTNNGGSWTNASNTGLTNPFVKSLISVGNNLFAATQACFGCNESGVFLSTDNGASWTPINNGITSNSANSLVSIGTNLFASSSGVGIFRSSDGGSSWAAVNSGYNNVVLSLVTDGTNLYAATSQGVYLSSNNGDSWSDINNGLLNTYNNLPYSIFGFAVSGNYLFAGTTNGIYMSSNHGTSWGIVKSNTYVVQSIFINNNIVFASASTGFYSHSLLSFPTITSVSPSSGIIGSTVTIKGSGFSTSPSNNSIYMGGVNITAATSASDSISFIVPSEAQTNQTGNTISVTVNGEVATLPYRFQVAPHIISFTPTSGPPHTSVTVSGTGFGDTRTGVSVNGHPALVYPSSSTSLILVVPDSVASGPITITVDGLTSTSANDFVVTAPAPLLSAGGYGNITWTQPIRTGAACKTMTMDSKYNLYFAGQSNALGSLPTYFNYTLFPENSNNSYLIKTDTSYNIKWRKIIEINNYGVVLPTKVQADINDNIVLTGLFTGEVTIDSVTFTLPSWPSAYQWGMFIVKFNSDGKLLWSNSIIANQSQSPKDLKIDDSNNIYISGSGYGTCNFYNNGTIASSINGDPSGLFGYYAKYDANGIFQWVKSLIPGSDNVAINAMEIDKNKNVYLTGSWYGYGSIESVSKQYSSTIIIIAKFDSTRRLVWLNQIGSLNNIMSYGRDIVLDEKQQCFYVTGYFTSGDFGSGVIDANDANIFLARYSLDGKLQWIKRLGAGETNPFFQETGTNLTLDKDGLVYLGGVIGPCQYGQCPDFNGTQLGTYHDPSSYQYFGDAFIGKYDSNGKMMWVQHFGDPNTDDNLTDLVKDDKGNLYFSGVTGRQAIFGPYQMPYDYSSSVGFAAKVSDGKVLFFSLSDNYFEIKADTNLTRSFQVITNKGWSISSNVNWLSTSATQGNGSSGIAISAQVNSSDARSGIITVTSDTGTLADITVLQLKSSHLTTVTGISPGSGQVIVIHPNPTKDALHILTENNSPEIQASIIDITGREVMNLIVTTNEIDVRSLPPGLYVLKIITSDGPAIRRFVKM